MTDDTVRKTRRPADAGQSAAGDMTRTLRDVGANLNHVTQEAMACYSDAMGAAMESGLQTSRMLNEFGRSYADAIGFVAATMSEITRESLACRDISDVIALQRKGTDGLNKGYENFVRLCNGFYDTWSKSIEPLANRTADIPERMLDAMAD